MHTLKLLYKSCDSISCWHLGKLPLGVPKRLCCAKLSAGILANCP